MALGFSFGSGLQFAVRSLQVSFERLIMFVFLKRSISFLVLLVELTIIVVARIQSQRSYEFHLTCAASNHSIQPSSLSSSSS